jgi:hypothetical protein
MKWETVMDRHKMILLLRLHASLRRRVLNRKLERLEINP